MDTPITPDVTAAQEHQADVLAEQSPNDAERWDSLTVKTLGTLAVTVPVLTVNGILIELIRLKASLAPSESLTIDWDVVPGVLLEAGLVNLIGFPVVFYLGAAATFVTARALGGSGRFWRHGYDVAVAYLKVALLASAVWALTLAIPCLGVLALGLLYAGPRLVSEAIANVHGLSVGRSFLAILIAFLLLIPLLIVIIGVLTLLGGKVLG